MAVPHSLVLAVVLIGIEAGVESSRCRGEPSCHVTRTHGMKSADCYKLDLHHFPRCLTSDAEVIDLTYNRIREITASDLKRYKNLRFLYLNENMITKIDPEAFADKTKLESLDLTYNGFSKPIPEVIFHLPSLKNLYLSQNQNINIIEIIENAAPITSPLARLDISYNNYEDLQRLPKLGVVSSLVTYNVSGMELILRTSDTAGLCNLKNFVNENVTAHFEEPCDCWTISRWFQKRGIRYTHWYCDIGEKGCPFEIPEEDQRLFDMCTQQHAEMLHQMKIHQGLIWGGAVLCVLFLVMLLVVYRWRRNVNKKRKRRRFTTAKEFNHI